MIPMGNGETIPPASYPGIPKLPSSGTPVPQYTGPSYVPPHIPAGYVPPGGPTPNDYSNTPPANYIPPGGGSGYYTTQESGGYTNLPPSLGGTTTAVQSGTGTSGKQMQTIVLVVAAGVLVYFIFLKK